MRLIVEGLDATNPSMPVRWCLEPSESRTLKDAQAQNIFILFVILYEGDGLGREQRELVAIDEMMTYLNFRRPGTHALFAKVIWGSNIKYLRRRYLTRRSTWFYDIEVMNYEKTALQENEYFEGGIDLLHALKGSTELEVIVPKEHFPKEPPTWLKRLANWGCECPPVDECQFRRRLLTAPIRLCIGMIWAVITTVIRVGSAILFGFFFAQRVNLKAILHPWLYDIVDVQGRFDDTWLFHDRDGRTRKGWKVLVLLHPLLYTLFFVIVTIVKYHRHVSYFMALVIVGKAILMAGEAVLHFLFLFLSRFSVPIGISILVLSLVILLRRADKKAKMTMRERERDPQYELSLEQRKAEGIRQYHEGLSKLLACRTTPLVASVDDLPPERRTLRLRYLKLKASVCRPFAAS